MVNKNDKIYHVNERSRTNKKYNLDLYDEYETEGFYQMSFIYKQDVIPDDLIGFNYMKSLGMNKNMGIHMYLDDYQFERLWNNPKKYTDILKQFQCVLTPDFSLYMDMPMAMKIWNVYRNRLLGQYWQRNGIKVIPTISWAEKETYKFCFDGIEKGSIVSISTIGVKRNKESLEIWKDGVSAMIEHIEPSMILVYGGEIEFDYKGVPVKYYDNKVIEQLKLLRKSKQMGGRGARSGVSVRGKKYGTEYKTLFESGNIKFVKYNDGKTAKTPMETMTKRRVYVTVTQGDELKAITLYDDNGKRKAQIDLTGKPHKVDGNYELPHKHNGYWHDENGTERLSKEE